jgi:hypothetical protein
MSEKAVWQSSLLVEGLALVISVEYTGGTTLNESWSCTFIGKRGLKGPMVHDRLSYTGVA